jgi:sulfur-carrier protein adenylyltransferase/sulfurtransferase
MDIPYRITGPWIYNYYHMKNISPRTLLAIILLPLGLIIAAVPQNTTKPYKLTAPQLLAEAVTKAQFVSPDIIADMLVNKDPSLQLIDVRSQAEFERFSLPDAINIPLSELLSPQWESVINQDIKMNVFFSNGSVEANQAWMVARHLGYRNNFVLQGGLNYWGETILNPQVPPQTSPDEEVARYDFRRAAGQALTRGSGPLKIDSVSTTPALKAPPVQKIQKKKKAQGGC